MDKQLILRLKTGPDFLPARGEWVDPPHTYGIPAGNPDVVSVVEVKCPMPNCRGVAVAELRESGPGCLWAYEARCVLCQSDYEVYVWDEVPPETAAKG